MVGAGAGPVLSAQADARVGGHFRVRFRMLNGSEHEASGQYLEVTRPRRLVMTWRWTTGVDPDEAAEESRVEIELRPIEGGTELTFTHARLATARSRTSHEQGWHGAPGKLEAYLREQSGLAAP